MKYGIKALMAAGVLVFAVGVQGALAAPASGKAAVNKENVQASSSAKAEAVPGAGVEWCGVEKSPGHCQLPRRVRAVQNP